ncbi:hypothetical protein GFJ94_02830 [Flavobacterium sp. LMO8]|uniref:LemA family protein n=1 Tax=Flavobacterium sp. LMO8 TaxID=2654244 RepID=UPI00129279D7|nr:LemA family protein [Flavobacterium sp. LMO8]MQP23996.1 hypothetical protein [Flavobacterium sp. LMO8]
MKFLKGCLITLMIFIGISFIGYLLFKNSVINNLESSKSNVKQSWTNYTENLKERNAELSKQNFKNDSLKFYWNKAKSIALTECSKELEFNEYKINQFVMSDSLNSTLNEKINLSLDNYNQNVREYNTYRVRFPNSIIARKTDFPKDFNYFDYRYGVDNESKMIRKKKVENWIINGGTYPE